MSVGRNSTLEKDMQRATRGIHEITAQMHIRFGKVDENGSSAVQIGNQEIPFTFLQQYRGSINHTNFDCPLKEVRIRHLSSGKGQRYRGEAQEFSISFDHFQIGISIKKEDVQRLFRAVFHECLGTELSAVSA